MLGGHHWQELKDEEGEVSRVATDPSSITQEDLILSAKATLALHLSIDIDDEPGLLVHARLNKECIPQHTVGHYERLDTLSEFIDAAVGKFKVFNTNGTQRSQVILAGTARYGPGVADCIAGSWITACEALGLDTQAMFEARIMRDHGFTMLGPAINLSTNKPEADGPKK